MSAAEPVQLAGKVALVTGAARRIGAAIAARLHSEQIRVAVHYRSSAADAEDVVARLNTGRPDSAKAFRADLNDPTAPRALVETVVDWAGRLDFLVNNASSFYPTPIDTVTEEQWLDLIGSNLKAPLFLSQAALPHLRRYNGSIVNIVDIHARRPLREHAVYGAAKAGLAMLTRSLAKDLAPDVRVNGVAPGAIEWPESDLGEDVKATILAQIPLGRRGEPDDIANCVVFLLRDATYVTGQIIPIDGGRSIGYP